MRLGFIVAYIFCFSVIAMTQGRVIDDSFFSMSMNQNRQVDVYLPPGYDSSDTTYRYPVIYFLHGAGGNQNSYEEIIFAADQLISSQSIDPIIIVKPNAGGGPATMSAYANTPLHGNIEDFIVNDLVQYIDSKYLTIAQRDKRAIMGHSVGGYGCIRLALKYPELFGSVASHAGFLDLTTDLNELIQCALTEKDSLEPFTSPDQGECIEAIFNLSYSFSPNLNNPPYNVDFPVDNTGAIIDSVWARWREHDATHLADQFSATGRNDLAFYLTCGRQDDLFPSVQAFADSLSRFGLGYIFDPYNGEHNDQLSVRFQISLAFLDSVLWNGVIRSNHVSIDRTYAMPGLDTVIITAQIPNPSNHNINVSARIRSLDKSFIDSLQLFDNGTHGDNIPADQIWSGSWPVKPEERFYFVDLQIIDLVSGLSHNQNGAQRFTTIGPVVFDGFTKINSSITNGRYLIRGRLNLRNLSIVETIHSVSANLTSSDDCVALVSASNPMYGDILPGQSAATSGYYIIQVDTNCQLSKEIEFNLTVESEGSELWHDLFSLSLEPLVDLESNTQEIPRDYALLQNYPNPFNPTTNFEFRIAESGFVSLKVFDVLGREVVTLLNEEKPAGIYKVQFNAEQFSSGIYFYTIHSGNFIRTRKMILIK
jgi:enterochelin esterase-like enzyme